MKGKDISVKCTSMAQFGDHKDFMVNKVKEEVHIQTELRNHVNIASAFGLWRLKDECLMIPMECMRGGTVLDELRGGQSGFQGQSLFHLVNQLVEEVRYMHSKEYAHMDLKVLFYHR